MKTIKSLLALSILVSAGAANAATVSTYNVTMSGTIAGYGALTGILSGSESGTGTAILDDSGSLTVTESYSSTTSLGGTQNILATTVFSGAYSGGVFTAASGARTVTSCSGPNCPATPYGQAFATAGGTLSLASGTLTDFYQTNGVANVNETYTFTSNTPAVPVPAAAWLFGSGLLGLAGTARRRRRVTAA